MSKSDLEFLQELTEAELTELVIIPLLYKMGYKNIRYTHSPLELGKDIVFSQESPLEGLIHYSAVIKRRKLSGSVSSSRSIREIYYQVLQSLKQPVLDPSDGRDIQISLSFIITPYTISQHAAQSIQGELQALARNSSGLLPDPQRAWRLGWSITATRRGRQTERRLLFHPTAAEIGTSMSSPWIKAGSSI